MEKKVKIASPRYQQIALDLASKIVKKHYIVGEKIYTRSTIASQYSVSPETARRAIAILSELGIVETTKGSGVIIKSYDKALEFIHQYNDIQTVYDLKKELLESVDRQARELDNFNQYISKLIEKTNRFRFINPFTPFEIEIHSNCPHINKTISEINFWHNTAATIIAIKRNITLIMSPGPYALLLENDIFYFVGDDNCLERVQNFLNLQNNE